MPNRIIKESICTSETIDQLSWFEEVFFYRLIVNCDDFGRMDARPAILKARLFPLKSVTEKQIEDALNKLSTVGIVALYEYDGRPYLQLVTWDKHQQIRSRKAKYPLPPEDIPCKREHIMPEEKDIEDLLYDVMSSTKRFEEHTLLSIERQVRVGESYLDIVAKTESSETLVFELKRGRLSNKAIDQISKYLTLINGNGILIGCGLSANFDIERCRSNDIAVVIYDDDLNMSLVLGNSAVNSIDLTLNHVKSRYAKLAPNPIQSNPNPNPNTNTNTNTNQSVCAHMHEKTQKNHVIDISEFVAIWESVTGNLMPPALNQEIIFRLSAGTDPELIKEALRLSAGKNKPAPYFAAIMQSWTAQGIKTYEQYCRLHKPGKGGKGNEDGSRYAAYDLELAEKMLLMDDELLDVSVKEEPNNA